MRGQQPEELPRRRVPLPAGAVVGQQAVEDFPRRRRQVRLFRQRPHPLHQGIVAVGAERHRPLPARPRLHRGPFLARRPERRLLRNPLRQRLHVHLDRLAHGVQRRRPLPRVRLQHLDQLIQVVGQHDRAVPRPADLDVERRLVGQRTLARIENRDHPVRRAPLRAANRRAPGIVDMPELRVVRPQRHLPPVLQNEPHPAPGDRRHLRPLSVDQLAAVVVAGPADAVPGPDLDRARLVDFQIVAHPSRRLDMARPAAGMAQQHPVALDPRHRQRLVLPHPVVDHVLVEHDCVAFPVVPHVALLGPRHAEAHQALDRERLAPQDPLVGQH